MRKELLTGLTALIIASGVGGAKADIILDETSQQGQYSIVDDATKDGYEIMCTLKWSNISENVPANNQISANGTFGSDQKLYKINTDDGTHDRNPPTYTINTDSFNIDYADGVVNTPNDSDTFKFFFNLGENIQTESEAQSVVDGLNDLINNPETYTSDSAWKFKRDINGTIQGPPLNGEFENSPSAYVPGKVKPFYISIDKDNVTLSNLTHGVEYSLQETSSLTNDWENIQTFTASSSETNFPHSTTNNAMFYRGREE